MKLWHICFYSLKLSKYPSKTKEVVNKTQPSNISKSETNCTLSTERKELTCSASTWNSKEHLSKSIHTIFICCLHLSDNVFTYLHVFLYMLLFFFSILACGNINNKHRNPLLPDSGHSCIVQIKVHTQKWTLRFLGNVLTKPWVYC